MKILLTGATGMIGKELGAVLVKEGHQLYVVTRNIKKAKEELFFPCEFIECDLTTEKFSERYCTDIEAVIHLAGDNIGDGVWTEKKKKRIYDSRINSTENLTEIFKDSEKLKVFINMSAAGFYPSQSDQLLDENQAPGNGFLSQVCKDWERALSVKKDKGYFKNARAIYLRSAMVLAKGQGALSKILLPYLNYAGVKVGAPDLWMSWIHIEDFINIILYCLKNENIYGPINCASPEQVLYKHFYKDIESRFFTFFKFWIPQSIVKSFNKSMLEFLYCSQRVQPEKLLKNGFHFRFDHLSKAFDDTFDSQAKGWRYFERKQYIPRPVGELFSFFADAGNLEKITPPFLGFKILSHSTEKVEKGTKIVYRLKIRGIPVKWKTNIAEWQPGVVFVDEQQRGPYKTWHHTHRFEEMGEGTLMTDQVRYRIPFRFIFNPLLGGFIKSEITQIFDFRKKIIKQLFG